MVEAEAAWIDTLVFADDTILVGMEYELSTGAEKVKRQECNNKDKEEYHFFGREESEGTRTLECWLETKEDERNRIETAGGCDIKSRLSYAIRDSSNACKQELWRYVWRVLGEDVVVGQLEKATIMNRSLLPLRLE